MILLATGMKTIEGLSILIPIYNRVVIDLARDLHHQALTSGIEFEILCYDDFSTDDIRQRHANHTFPSHTTYRELDRNHGRSAIRNLLASNARYSHLLFLDCDSKIILSDFIRSYISYPQYKVVIGGRVYSPTAPSESQLYLHWLIGTSKEVLSAGQRGLHPYQSLMFNNILIEKDTFLSIRLDETIKGYGHEDSLFGYMLKQKNIVISHIDNPVEHESLDTNDEFLKKSREAVRNLAYLVNQYALGKDTRLFRSYHFLRRYGAASIYKSIFARWESQAISNLLGGNPRPIWLDLLKLFWFMEDMSRSKED